MMMKAATDRQSVAIPADTVALLTVGPDLRGQRRIAGTLGLRPFQHTLSGHEQIGQRADDKQHARADLQSLVLGIIADRRKQLLAQVMGLQQVAELAYRRFIWCWFAPKGNADKHPHCPRIIQRLFHRRAGQMNLYLKYSLQSPRRWSVGASLLVSVPHDSVIRITAELMNKSESP